MKKNTKNWFEFAFKTAKNLHVRNGKLRIEKLEGAGLKVEGIEIAPSELPDAARAAASFVKEYFRKEQSSNGEKN